ncbi:unnamed protein product [Strongylus vulgaris]|uniref:Uncharacterized protein n=1 Tax=Strongylus vulgaris TaxID=40348 RepID=A0A3P7I6Y3_STRVU|nr:unnamed protein product [Strongylus vulgaris]
MWMGLRSDLTSNHSLSISSTSTITHRLRDFT